MCYAKPGPRCAGHARQSLDRAKLFLDSAIVDSDVYTRGENIDASGVLDSRQKIEDTRAEYDDALREYETTPEGQQMLQQSIERLREEGNNGAVLAEIRLAEAVSTRQRQVEDYAASMEYGQRLQELDPGQQRAVDLAERSYDAAIMTAVIEESVLEDADAESQRAVKAHKMATDELSAANDWLASAQQGVDAATVSVPDDRESDLPLAYQIKAERQVDVERAKTRMDEAKMRVDHTSRVVEEAKAHMGFSRMVADGAKLERDQTKALIGGGIGHSFRKLHLSQQHNEDMVVRNPDGTLNVAKYDSPTDGFPYGRFHRGVGTENVPMTLGRPQGIKFSDGTLAWSTTNFTESNLPQDPENLVILPPEPGAVRALPARSRFTHEINRAG